MNQAQTMFSQFRLRRGLIFGAIIIAALLAFEIFNYSTTDYALSDLLGDLKFLGMRWATVLAIAFCGIDFAGIARLFTPGSESERGPIDHNESWYLFGAWLLAATMNAMLTWWGVSLAVLGRHNLSDAVVSHDTLLHVVPIFVAVLVWLIRVLIIGAFSAAGDRLFTQGDLRQRSEGRAYSRASAMQMSSNNLGNRATPSRAASTAQSQRRAVPRPPSSTQIESNYGVRSEPTYHPLSMSASNNPNGSHLPIDKSSFT